jgi:multiple sugar transport system ATP-binding protein
VATLEFDEVSKVFDNGVHAVRQLSLTVADGEFVVLVGPSGCGKTTALRMLAGLERITAGEIRIGGVRVNEVQPRDRDVAMVFQNYALYPHLSVYDNIGFGLRMRHTPKPERRARIERAAAILGLTDQLNRKPSQLSGGQRQRVAMGRAIVREPQAFLMDEPLSNLDARLRVQMRTEIARIQHDLGVTTVYVTHDQVEAMTMADRVAVLRGGELQQLDTPQRVYAEPANLFVASFIGSPAMNLVEAQLRHADGGLECHIGEYTLHLPPSFLAERPALANAIGKTVAAGIRPEAITVAQQDATGLRGRVVVSEELGSEVLAHIEIEATPVVREEILEGIADEPLTGTAAATAGHRVSRTTVVARLPADAAVERDTTLPLTIDPNKIHFFDLNDGRALRAGVTRDSSLGSEPVAENPLPNSSLPPGVGDHEADPVTRSPAGP